MGVERIPEATEPGSREVRRPRPLPGGVGSSGFSGLVLGDAGVPGRLDFSDSLRGLEVAAAQDAAHGYGVYKMRVGWTFDVGADFAGHPHLEPARRPRVLLPARRRPWK